MAQAAGFTDRDIIPRHKVLPPISTARHNKGVFHQDNYIMCVPPRPNVQDMQTKGIMPLDTSGHTLDEAELYNPQFAHATRGRTYTYLQRRKLQEPEDRFPRAMTAAQAMTWSMKRAQAHNEANSPKVRQCATPCCLPLQGKHCTSPGPRHSHLSHTHAWGFPK